jgi:hypothetical protein
VGSTGVELKQVYAYHLVEDLVRDLLALLVGDLLAGGDGHLPADLVPHLGVQEFRAVQEVMQEMGQEMDRTDDSPPGMSPRRW